MILLLKLLIAHVIGDFALQTDKWITDEKQIQFKSVFLNPHPLIHAFALIVLLIFELQQYWPIVLSIVASHYITDFLKSKFETKQYQLLSFIVEQAIHLTLIGILVYIYEPYRIKIALIYSPKILTLILALLSVTFVASIIMKEIMFKWRLTDDSASDSLKNAGKYIGILERLFVFGFVMLNQWQAIGFLIAAKSVFRFGDLSKAKDRKLTEYILIGTLLSFGIAVSVGITCKYVIKTLGN